MAVISLTGHRGAAGQPLQSEGLPGGQFDLEQVEHPHLKVSPLDLRQVQLSHQTEASEFHLRPISQPAT